MEDDLFGVFEEAAVAGPAAASSHAEGAGASSSSAAGRSASSSAAEAGQGLTGSGRKRPRSSSDDKAAAAAGLDDEDAAANEDDESDEAAARTPAAADGSALDAAAPSSSSHENNSSSAASAAAAGSSAAADGAALADDRGAVDEGQSTTLDGTLPPKERMAKTYPFELDPFQRRAIACLERDESVLVSAHTSAGKTVVAEYAIAMALKAKQRVIYTSPIKALSNQKYRELYEEFGDVGLMTGDTTIAPNASCLVMTTEILRSMLYRGSEVVREVKWVIYDEVHYMRDRERGVVWEESIILLPDSVRYVFLSATIPNAREFAGWISWLHRHTCHVVYTQYRPTPLQHFMFPAGAEGIFLIVDERGRFRDDNFTDAMATLEDEDATAMGGTGTMVGAGPGASSKGKRRTPQRGKGPTDLYRVVKMVMERGYDPVIVFSFSKRETERNAMQIAKLDLTSKEEKSMIEQIFKAALASLAEDDRQLPQIVNLLPLLKRGIGIHHGGLLPILKEVIEILFSESYIKVLFATETFAMGVNMPAKTVIFTSAEKYDGETTRMVSAGEYTQMSGRAGRRGLDDRGIVIWMVPQRLERDTVRGILCGSADPLDSAFHLGYNMLLNVMRIEDSTVDPEAIMAKSFHQFQAQRAVPTMRAEALRLREKAAAIEVEGEAEARAFVELLDNRQRAMDALRAIVTRPAHAVRFLQPGRVVRVVDGKVDWGWGVVVSFRARAGSAAARAEAAASAVAARNRGPKGQRRKRAKAAEDQAAAAVTTGPASDVVVDILLDCAVGVEEQEALRKADAKAAAEAARAAGKDPADGEGDDADGAEEGLNADGTVAVAATFAPGAPRPAVLFPGAPSRDARVLPVVLSAVDTLTQLRVAVPSDLRAKHARADILRRLGEVRRRLEPKGGLPVLDPADDMGIEDEGLAAALEARREAEAAVKAHPMAAAAAPAIDAAGEAATGAAGAAADSGSADGAEAASLREAAMARLRGVRRKMALERRALWVEREVDRSKALVMRGTLKRMTRVLRRLGHVDPSSVVQLKGRVACEVNTADELLCTELMFEGAFNDLTPAQTAALMSCLVASDRSKDDDEGAESLAPELGGPLRVLQEAARRVARVSEEAGIEIEVDDYVKSMSPSLMQVVFSWASGARFSEVATMTKEFEGSIIRVIRRLEELLRQLADAARAIGDEALESKFKASSTAMRRDIVFAASLYT